VILIVGAGLTGLSAAYHLQQAGREDYLLVEAEARVGGLCRTREHEGFRFDYSIHVLFTRDAYAADLICGKLLEGRVRRQTRQSYCHSAGRYTEFPYQANMHGLPAEVIADNLVGLVEARGAARNGPPPHFEEWITRTFGQGIARNFMLPYNRKQWAWDLKEMAYDWIADRVPLPDLRDVLLGALRAPGGRYGTNSEFWYPEDGGIEALPRAFLRHIPREKLRLGARIVGLDTRERVAVLADGTRLDYERLVSTIPLPRIVKLLDEALPEDVRASAAALRYNVVHTVDIGVRGTELGADRPMHWAYFPEEDVVFHRLSFPHRFSERMVPPGCASIQAEVSESVQRPRERGALVRETLAGLVKVGILDAGAARAASQGGRVVWSAVAALDPAYVIYDLDHRRHVATVKACLQERRIDSGGRFGDWEYLNMDAAILRGRDVAERCL
jgi:protoporphyrinogen oxidase